MVEKFTPTQETLSLTEGNLLIPAELRKKANEASQQAKKVQELTKINTQEEKKIDPDAELMDKLTGLETKQPDFSISEESFKRLWATIKLEDFREKMKTGKTKAGNKPIDISEKSLQDLWTKIKEAGQENKNKLKPMDKRRTGHEKPSILLRRGKIGWEQTDPSILLRKGKIGRDNKFNPLDQVKISKETIRKVLEKWRTGQENELKLINPDSNIPEEYINKFLNRLEKEQREPNNLAPIQYF